MSTHNVRPEEIIYENQEDLDSCPNNTVLNFKSQDELSLYFEICDFLS